MSETTEQRKQGPRKQNDRWKEFAMEAASTVIQGALFGLGGFAISSLAKSLSRPTPMKGLEMEGSVVPLKKTGSA
jgi:hypothetical protein